MGINILFHKILSGSGLENSLTPKILIDSNIWIANFFINDSTHKQAKSLIHKVSNIYRLYVSPVVIGEVLTVLRLKKVETLQEIYEGFLSEKFAHIDPTPLNLAAIKPIFEKFPKLSIVDAFLLYLCWDKNYALLTLDRNLVKAAKELGLKVIDKI